jgi:predicted ArsR family transcriptional regulator
MRNRSTPITLKQLAAILRVTPRSVQNSLEPLVADGRVVRQKILVERRLAGKQTWAYGYSAAEQKQKPPKRPKFQFHDPFNMTRRTL